MASEFSAAFNEGGAAASGVSSAIHEVLPKGGIVLAEEGDFREAICKPKLLPMKSSTLEKLEKLEREATEAAAAAAARR
jgi:BBSome-interacting protein 1